MGVRTCTRMCVRSCVEREGEGEGEGRREGERRVRETDRRHLTFSCLPKAARRTLDPRSQPEACRVMAFLIIKKPPQAQPQACGPSQRTRREDRAVFNSSLTPVGPNSDHGDLAFKPSDPRFGIGVPPLKH